jgi:hypothetical protein
MEPQELSETERHKKGRQKAFLAAYEQVGSIARAAEAAKIGRTTHWAWMRTDPEYPKKFAAAQTVASEVLIDEATRRAVDGVEEPVGFYKGKAGGTVKRYSDILLMFLIKAKRPEYRDSSRLHLGFDAGDQDGDPRLGEKTLAAVDLKKLAEW